MKVQVVHDGKGNITSAGIAGPQASGRVQLIPPEGQMVSEVDVPDLETPSLADLAEDTSLEFLAHVAERWRIDTSGKAPKLVPKAGS
jgi:hypothetical protein